MLSCTAAQDNHLIKKPYLTQHFFHAVLFCIHTPFTSHQANTSTVFSCLKHNFFILCFHTQLHQITHVLTQPIFTPYCYLLCRANAHTEQEEDSWLSLVKKRAERKLPSVLKPGSTTDKVRRFFLNVLYHNLFWLYPLMVQSNLDRRP